MHLACFHARTHELVVRMELIVGPRILTYIVFACSSRNLFKFKSPSSFGTKVLSHPGLRDYIHNVVQTELRDKTSYLLFMLVSTHTRVGLVGTEVNYLSCI
jgi:hypothetical protein